MSLPLVGAGPSAAAVGNGLLNNLIAYWPLNEAGGANDALDLHSNGLTLTQVSSPGADTGKVYATARTFSGSLDSFTRASGALLQTGDVDVTFAAWVYMTSKGTYNHIISKWPEEYLLRYQGGATDRFHFEVKNAGGYKYVDAASSGSPSTDVWYLVMGWHDAANNQLGMQINNGAVDAISESGGITVSSAAFYVGVQYNTLLPFAGRIGPVAMWKSAAGGGGVLTAAQRTALYNSGAGLAYAGFTA